MLEFEIVPDCALKNELIQFYLGMPICLVLAGLQKHYQIFKGVELLYSEKEPLSFDVLLNLTCDGIKLGFDANFQRLKVIEIYDLNRLTLYYGCTLLSSPAEIPDIQKINQIFGATRPGVYDSAQQVYMLKWRGLCCTLPAESKLKPHCVHGFSSLEFPCDSSLVVEKISIYDGSIPADGSQIYNSYRIPEIPINCYYGNCYAESVNVIRRKGRTVGLAIDLKSECIQPDTYYDLYLKTASGKVNIGDFSQEVLSAIGAPNRIFYKSEDKMKIHLPSHERVKRSAESDYFFNYFTLGLDVLFDGQTHRVRKLLLHTNYPGHYDFGIYSRCNFQMLLTRDSPPTAATADESGETNADARSASAASDSSPTITVTAFTKWDEIESFIGLARRTSDYATSSAQDQPVVLNRCGPNNDLNPFGSTFCFRFQDVIFEVMGNNHIATVILFGSVPSVFISQPVVH